MDDLLITKPDMPDSLTDTLTATLTAESASDTRTRPETTTPAEISHDAHAPTPIWIERLTRHGEVLSRERCFGETVTIGRGYTNDVVIDDPSVAERHLHIVRSNDGSLHAKDLGSLSGLFLSPRGPGVRETRLDGNQALRIGATWLRVRTADYPVPAEQPLPVHRRLWPISLALALACAGLEVLDLWRGQSAEIQWLHQISSTLVTFAAVLGWTSAWAVIGRIFSHSAKYSQHLLIAFTGLLVIGVASDLVPLLAYSLSLSKLPSYEFIISTVSLATMVFYHLRLVLSTHRRLQFLVIGALALLVIVLDALKLQSPGVGRTTTYVLHDLAPPALRLARPQTEDDFFHAGKALKTELDKARNDEQPESGEDENSDDENDE